MSFSRFELGTHGFVIHLQFHYAMQVNANYREKKSIYSKVIIVSLVISLTYVT